MDWGYYTFPALLIAIAVALYTWQDSKMKALEKGRRSAIARRVKELLNHRNDLENKIFEYLSTAYENDKDLLMPIRQFLPYKRIACFLAAAMIIATVCAILHSKLDIILFFGIPNISLNDALIVILIGLCILPARWIREEFSYTRRISQKFDNSSEK